MSCTRVVTQACLSSAPRGRITVPDVIREASSAVGGASVRLYIPFDRDLSSDVSARGILCFRQ